MCRQKKRKTLHADTKLSLSRLHMIEVLLLLVIKKKKKIHNIKLTQLIRLTEYYSKHSEEGIDPTYVQLANTLK